MSQHEFAPVSETLNHENLQLLQHIDYLEERLSQYENVPTLQETLEMSREETSDDRVSSVSEWNVWPYSWATATWQTTTERLHSFHGRLQVARTIKLRVLKEARDRRGFSQAHCDDAELTLT